MKGTRKPWKWVRGNNSSCLECGKAFHIKPSQLERGRGKYCSKACYMKNRSEWMKDKNFNPTYKVDFKGDKNPNWRGGLSFIEYPLGWDYLFKEQIRARDGYKCQLCGVPEVESGRRLDIHHIDYNKNNLKKGNLMTLCRRCHMRTNYNRDYWYSFLSEEVMSHVRQ